MPAATKRAETLIQRGRALAAEAQQWAERTIFWRVWERLLENEFIDRAVALGAKAFVSFFPTIIVVAAFAPPSIRTSILGTITRRAGLSGSGLQTVKGAFATADNVRKATGILGLIFTVFYINSFTTALSRVYTRAWRRPPMKAVAKYTFGAQWLLGILIYFAMIGALRALLHGPATALFAVVAIAASIALWWVTAWLMLQRHVRFRVLGPTGILTGVAFIVYGVTASLWMPTTVSNNQQQFGFFGVALALTTYLSGAATIIVVGACVAPVCADDTGIVGRLTRGAGRTDVLMPGAAPSFAAPDREVRFADALGMGRDDMGDN
jgi:membrane protein